MVNISFLIFGFMAVISQTLLLREMIIVFTGNEFSIALVLAEWLLGSTLGSYAASAADPKNKLNHRKTVSLVLMLTGIYLLLLFPLFGNIRNILNLLPGQAAGLQNLLFASLILVFPLSFLIGAQFSLGARWAQNEYKEGFSWKIYLWESAGFLTGGVIFTFVFIRVFLPAPVFLITACLSLTLAFLIFFKKYIFGLAAGLIFVFAAYLLMPGASTALEKYSDRMLYPGFNVVKNRNTPYGRLTVLEREKQKYLLSDASVVGTFPPEETENAEAFAYIPLLYGHYPGRVLVMGGEGKYTAVLLKNSPLKVDYIESNPDLMKALVEFNSEIFNKEINLGILYGDGRNILKKSKIKYDIIYIGFSYPATISLNRFYTQEFFKDIKKNIPPEGLVVLSVPSSTAYLGNELLSLDNILIQTLKNVFKYIKILPGEQALIIGSESPFEKSEDEIKKEFSAFPFKTKFISWQYIKYRINGQKEKWLRDQLAKYKAQNTIRWASEGAVNSDFKPVAVKDSLIYFYAMAGQKSVPVLNYLFNFIWIFWIILVIWFLSGKMGASGTAFTSGAAGMGLQIIFLIVIQIKAGNIYSFVGFSNAVFMAGVALGAVFYKKYIYAFKVRDAEAVFLLWAIILAGLFYFKIIYLPLIFVFSFLTGLIVGFEFPLLVAEKNKNGKNNEGVSAGRIYAFDLLGGCFGAIVIGALMLPSLGLFEVLYFIVILKLITILWWIKTERKTEAAI